MEFRRFGRTGIEMSVFSCGGMRYQQSWSNDAFIESDNQKNLEATIHRALDLGINHIETARGYGTSELQLGRVLPNIDRERYILQTKISPKYNPEEFRADFEKSLRLLNADYVDLLGIHGINNEEELKKTFEAGSLDMALQLRKQGKARFIGFSTHGPTGIILRAIESGQFDYVNLHWYYIDPFRWPAIEAATRHEMGVFIISPSDKGGMLYNPPAKLVDLCRPLTPIQFNDLFTMRPEDVHTLSLGAARPSDFDEHIAALDVHDRNAVVSEIENRLQQTMYETLGEEYARNWNRDLPPWDKIPGEINVSIILWLWNLTRAFDMTEYAKMRYNLLGNGGHWFPGQNAEALISGEIKEGDLLDTLESWPFRDRLIPILTEAHELLAGEEQKRLSKS